MYPLKILSGDMDVLSSFIVALNRCIERAAGLGGLLSRAQQKMTGLSTSIIGWEAEADDLVHWLPALIEWVSWRSWLPQRWSSFEPSRANTSGQMRLEMLGVWFQEYIVQDDLLTKE